MSDSFTATIITSVFLLVTILLSISLAEELPADFMNRNYTGATIKPKPAAQIAFLAIAGTFLSMFLVWAVTPQISHYYDYLLTNLLPLLAMWWFLALLIAMILRQISKRSNGLRWIVAIGLVAVVGIGFFAPSIKSVSTGFLTKPYLLQGTVVEKNSTTTKNGTRYSVRIDDLVYNVTRNAYSDLRIGETVELVHTAFIDMVFPPHHMNLTFFGMVLLIVNALSIMCAIIVIGYSFTKEAEKL